MLLQQQAMLKQQTPLRTYAGQVDGYEREIERLKAPLDKLQRMLFGQRLEKKGRKREKKIHEAEKRRAEMETWQGAAKQCLESAAAAVVESDTDDTSKTPAESPVTTGRTSSRKPLPSSLPRETRRILPSETVCPSCGGGLVEMSESISEQLEIVNNAFKVIETVRPKLACCRGDVIAQAPIPPKTVDRSYAGPGLLASILVSTYAEYIPLYRQSEIYSRYGLTLSRNTMVRWVKVMAEKHSPLCTALKRYVLSASKVHTDDTPVKVLAPGNGKTRTVRMWVYVCNARNTDKKMPPAVWFAYAADRKGEHPQQHLAQYSGVLQADAYGGYDALYESVRVTEAGCMAHARRKVYDEPARRPTELTREALKRIGGLYAIEAEIRGSPKEQRLAA